MIVSVPGILMAKKSTGAAIALVQTAVYLSSSNPSSHTINSGNGWAAPVAGHVIILCIVSDTTINDASLTGAGWTQVNNAVDNSGTYMYWKVSAGTETSVTVNLTGGASCNLALAEVSGVTTLDKTAAATGQGTTTIGTGTTAATTAANELIMALAGIAPGGAAPPTVSSWNNSFVSQESGTNTGVGIGIGIDMATKIVSATGAQTATATLTGTAGSHNSGIIATFK